MALLTKYGTIWGAIPQTAGRVFWVAPSASYTVDGRAYPASDNNDGLSPERALLTLTYAATLANASGDVVVALPGSHTLSSSIAASTAGVTFTGLPGGLGNALYPRATITGPTGDQIMNVTAADVEIAHLLFIPITQFAAIDASAAADRLHIHHCAFDMETPVAHTSTIGISALAAGIRMAWIHHCLFFADGAQGNAIVATGMTDSAIEDCWFKLSAGTWASAIICGAGTDRVNIGRCVFQANSATATVWINGTGANVPASVLVHDCRFSEAGGVEVDNFDAGECEIVENYIADTGVGMTSSMLVSLIT